MPSQSLSLLEKKFYIPAAVLCATAGAVIFSAAPSDVNPDVFSESKREPRKEISAETIASRNQHPSALIEKDGAARKTFKTKASARPTDSTISGEAARKEFWRGAKLPDDLVAASLPVLEAAVQPTKISGSEEKKDFAADVPAAFAEEETFDYKSANEQLYLWLVTEPEAASAWLSEQPDYSRYDMAFALVADAMGYAGRADIGEQWANLIPSTTKREEALVGMYAGMYSRSQTIPENMRGRVLLSDRID